MSKLLTNERRISPLAKLRQQHTHLLFVLSNANPNYETTFLDWYNGVYRQTVSNIAGVLSIQHYEQHEVDITLGRCARPPFNYLGLYELVLDSAQVADGLIERITTLHLEQAAVQPPATWLYYPVSEKVGRSPEAIPSMVTLTFANGVAGQEAEFREWYATRHIRHALDIPALVSGQCFERTQFQRPGALEAIFSTIAVYEQEGPPEAIIESYASLPEGRLYFPTLDTSRVAESVYRPV